jgi:hypothetical protein
MGITKALGLNTWLIRFSQRWVRPSRFPYSEDLELSPLNDNAHLPRGGSKSYEPRKAVLPPRSQVQALVRPSAICLTV